MVDTTCTGKRTLHYARANFKNNFDITNIKTDSAALQAYKAPGSFGETGDNRQYSFLMYTNPNRQPINNLKLPAEGAVFDVKQFQTDNNLPDAQAGVGMIVKLGGQADCGGDQTNTVPASSFPTARSTTTAARTSTAGAGSKPTSAAGAAPSSNAGAASSSGLSSSAVAGASSTTAARRPSTLTSSSAAQNPGNDNNSAPVSSARRPSSSATAPTPAQSDAAEPSDSAEEPNGAATTVRTSGRPVGSPTASSSVAQQTANAAPGKSMEHMRLFAAFMAVAGLMFW